jgi:hypothetical protein
MQASQSSIDWAALTLMVTVTLTPTTNGWHLRMERPMLSRRIVFSGPIPMAMDSVTTRLEPSVMTVQSIQGHQPSMFKDVPTAMVTVIPMITVQ